MSFLEIFEYSSVFIFALTGALVASRAQLDPVGFLFIAALTAVGGGTVRDLLLDRNPLFWIDKPIVLVIASVAAMVTFFTAHLLESRLKTLTWLDAAALAVAVPTGVGVAVNQSQEWPIVLIMGVTTGCFGGLMRDVVCNEVPLVLKQGELYISAAFIGAGAAMLAISAGIAQPIAFIFCAGVTFALRAGSLALGWSMPAYKSRPPRR
jgi:uncharacterized membrane protein YeiH